ncbi:MAG: hypothetical protein WD069_11305 [Planctomycetales bacterium]
MSSGVLAAAMAVALGAGPYAYETYGEYPAEMGAMESYGEAPVGGFGGGYGEQLYPYDSPDAWQHGYFQEIPAYGGFNAFRPYNYKHVLSQSQAAGGWGMAPNLPYSQQFWHRYHDQAAMKQHLSRIGASEYTAELARIRAQHDFAVQQKLAQQPQSLNPNAPARLHEPWQSAPLAGSQQVDPAGYQQPGRIDDLQNEIRRQAQQLQALQHAIERERQFQAQPGYQFQQPMRNR